MLTLRYGAEEVDHGTLDVVAQVDGFSGRSSTWFNRDDIDAFADKLSRWPLLRDGSVELVGGTGTKSDGTFPERVLVGLSFVVSGAKGGLALRAELHDEDAGCHAELHIAIDYAALAGFSPALRRMLQEPGFEAVLEGTGR